MTHTNPETSPPPPNAPVEPRRVRVELGDRAYDVEIGTGLLASLGRRAAEVAPPGRAFVVVDSGVPQEMVRTALRSLVEAGFETATSALNARESNKTIDTVSRLLHEIGETRHERGDPVVAIGGGVTGDIAGFVGAIYKRGVPVIQCPTTLLAMVDASVGGKTGVNLNTRSGLKKNLVGAFWQPSLVLADVGTLASLDERHIRSGLAECVKHALIGDGAPGRDAGDPGALFEWTSRSLVKLRMGDPALLADLVARNVEVKAAFVAADEREEASSPTGGRALLNLGHTFAHAIETIPHLTPDGNPDHSPLQHGEAVALGLVAASGAASELGRLDEAQATSIRVAVERLGLESRLMALPPDEEIVEAMWHDKKVSRGKMRLVVPVALGRSEVVVDPPESVVRAGLSAIRFHRPRA